MTFMKIFFSIFFWCLSLSLFAQEDLVNKVKAKLDRVKDYQAEGRMTLDVSFIDAPPSKVTIFFKKPDKFKVKKEWGHIHTSERRR